jgi:trimethylamine:corrinoid methyltransferase-like protein
MEKGCMFALGKSAMSAEKTCKIITFADQLVSGQKFALHQKSITLQSICGNCPLVFSKTNISIEKFARHADCVNDCSMFAGRGKWMDGGGGGVAAEVSG